VNQQGKSLKKNSPFETSNMKVLIAVEPDTWDTRACF
jgi:hypothetical protein